MLVLTDAICFTGQWQTGFGKYGPKNGPSTLLDGMTVETTYLVDVEQPDPRGARDVGAEIPDLGNVFTMLGYTALTSPWMRWGQRRWPPPRGFNDSRPC